jgi:2-oxoglutarate dehydrogenase E2 component (dihydrolipoamide succinyltransferase)
MTTEIRVPALGESVTEATIAQWFKKTGEAVSADEPLVELETDKVTLEVPAPASGVLESIDADEGATVNVGALLGAIAEGAGAAPAAPAPAAKAEEPKAAEPAPAPAAPPPAAPVSDKPLSPAVQKLVTENRIDPSAVTGTGKDGRLTKADVLDYIAKGPEVTPAPAPAPAAARAPSAPDDASREERVRMTRLRQTIARRLKDAQNTAAMLTTFNEVDMTNVMATRSRFKELFEKKHGIKLGFMSFFTKACIQALKDVPAVNAEIDADELVYKNYYHIGVAVGTDKGLVVPVVRDADQLSLAGIELAINKLGKKARDGDLSIAEMQGGTFTISNGGVYGSLMSTPILNAPQSGILGMHKIQERPMVVDGEIKIRPMMYLALSYDHRIVDGKEAVTFLVRIKEILEDPERMILDL